MAHAIFHSSITNLLEISNYSWENTEAIDDHSALVPNHMHFMGKWAHTKFQASQAKAPHRGSATPYFTSASAMDLNALSFVSSNGDVRQKRPSLNSWTFPSESTNQIPA